MGWGWLAAHVTLVGVWGWGSPMHTQHLPARVIKATLQPLVVLRDFLAEKSPEALMTTLASATLNGETGENVAHAHHVRVWCQTLVPSRSVALSGCYCVCLQVFEGMVAMLKLRGDLSRGERRRLRALGMKTFLANFTRKPRMVDGGEGTARDQALLLNRRAVVDPRLDRSARVRAAHVVVFAALFPCESDAWSAIWEGLGQRGESWHHVLGLQWALTRVTGRRLLHRSGL